MTKQHMVCAKGPRAFPYFGFGYLAYTWDANCNITDAWGLTEKSARRRFLKKISAKAK